MRKMAIAIIVLGILLTPAVVYAMEQSLTSTVIAIVREQPVVMKSASSNLDDEQISKWTTGLNMINPYVREEKLRGSDSASRVSIADRL